jgi:chromatin segregation and condensation protein Rec8/ScpA/Scc1 (kleisin family)
VEDLARLAAAALGRRDEPVPPMAHVEPTRVSLRATFLQLARLLPVAGSASYRALCSGKSMLEAVVHFLAILELLKAGVVRVEQAHPRDDIRMTWIGDDGWSPTLDAPAHDHGPDRAPEFASSPAPGTGSEVGV